GGWAMRDVSSGAAQDVEFDIIQVHAMGEDHTGAREPEVVQINNISLAGFALDELDLLDVLGGMGMNGDAALGREAGHLFEQFARTRHCEPWRKGVPDAAAGAAMPAVKHYERLGDGCARFFEQGIRYTFALVHHALAGGCAEAGIGYCMEDTVSIVDSLHGQGTGGAAANHLSDAELRGCIDGLEGMSGFHRPNALFQPVDEGEVVGVPSEKRLAEVDVCLYKARQQDEASAVYDFAGCPLRGTQPGDSAALYQYIALKDV